MVYSVDEVSERLGIPRPTLYRYLREYSIPHLRQAGKISIPEESLDRIREARELHREGLGTESVRRRLWEKDNVEVEELAERLDRLSGAIERLREDLLEPVRGRTNAQREALQTLHEKQDALLSEVSRLKEMVQELSRADSGLEREAFRGEASGGAKVSKDPKVFSEQPVRFSRTGRNTGEDPTPVTMAHEPEAEPSNGGVAAKEDPDPTTRMNGHEPPTDVYSKSGKPFVVFTRRKKFGVLAEGRWVLALLAALSGLLVVAVLVWWSLSALGEEAQEQTDRDEPEAQEKPQSASESGETPPAVEVPGLIGLALPEAEKEIDEVGLEQGIVREIQSYAIPGGMVAAQEPAVGMEVDPGAPVNLVVSSGPPETASNAGGETGTG